MDGGDDPHSVGLPRVDCDGPHRHASWHELIDLIWMPILRLQAVGIEAEGFFSKFARSVPRHIRAASKQELKERITAGVKDVNRYPVIHTWSYKLAEAA
jgi:hypothetical protein